MSSTGCIAMILAGGRGERLGTLTRYYPKPAVHFGGNRRLIDFTLRNCLKSGVDATGILSQYLCHDLHAYIEDGYRYIPGYDSIHMLSSLPDNPYQGTADAVLKNMDFIEAFNPENVLILAGDHIYGMDYGDMLSFHKEHDADVTVASTGVSAEEARRFGIIGTDKSGRITRFDEKPDKPRGKLASMGVYIFKLDALKKYLRPQNSDAIDFGKDIMPRIVRGGEKFYTYRYDGYWQDVGTVDSLLESSLAQIKYPGMFFTVGRDRTAITPDVSDKAYSSGKARIGQSLVEEGCSIFGKVERSVISDRVTVCEGAEIVDSYIMPGAYIGRGAKINRTIVGTGAMITDGVSIGGAGLANCVDKKICARGVSLVAPWICINKAMGFQPGSHITEEIYKKIAFPAQKETIPYYGLAGGFSEPSASFWPETRPFAANTSGN